MDDNGDKTTAPILEHLPDSETLKQKETKSKVDELSTIIEEKDALTEKDGRVYISKEALKETLSEYFARHGEPDKDLKHELEEGRGTLKELTKSGFIKETHKESFGTRQTTMGWYLS